MTPTPDPLREAWEALRQSIGTGAEDQGAEHWHHASGGRQMPTERDGVFVDRQTVHDLIAHFRPAIDAALAQPAPAQHEHAEAWSGLRALAEAANRPAPPSMHHGNINDDYLVWEAARRAFEDAATPFAVLALLAFVRGDPA